MRAPGGYETDVHTGMCPIKNRNKGGEGGGRGDPPPPVIFERGRGVPLPRRSPEGGGGIPLPQRERFSAFFILRFGEEEGRGDRFVP